MNALLCNFYDSGGRVVAFPKFGLLIFRDNPSQLIQVWIPCGRPLFELRVRPDARIWVGDHFFKAQCAQRNLFFFISDSKIIDKSSKVTTT